MFIGHFAVGFAAKKFSPKTSLATLFIACQMLDLIWPVAMVLGLETASHNHAIPTFNALDLKYVPYSHSLGMAVFWSALLGLAMKLFKRSKREALVVALVVFSHWILDYATHVPDLPLWFGPSRVGLGLWRSQWGTFVVEIGLFAAGLCLYRNQEGPLSGRRKFNFYSLTAFLLIVYVASVFGPKPPETDSPFVVAGPAFAIWLLVLWSYYVDKRSA
jgi:hypothetical protein